MQNLQGLIGVSFASWNSQFKQQKTTNPQGKSIAIARSGYISWCLTFLVNVKQLP